MATSSPSAGRGEQFPALDGLRAVAILLVVVHNVNVLGDPLAGLYYVWGKLIQFGWAGVQLFFVLSGFLITKGLLDTRSAGNYYSGFFGRRILRIFPLYYASLILLFIVWPLAQVDAPTGTVSVGQQVWYWTFLSNWSSPLGGDVKLISHFWSLAVEEQFYFLWPFVVRHWPGQSLLRICVGLILIAFAIRLSFVLLHASAEYSYTFTFCRMDALAAGAIVAVVYQDETHRSWMAQHGTQLILAAALTLLVGDVSTRSFYREGAGTLTYGHLSLDIAFALLVAAAISEGSRSANWYRSALSQRSLRAIGKYSFGMYVIHYPINRYLTRPWMEAMHPSRGVDIGYAVAMVVASLLLAMASYHLLEKRFLRLKVFFRPTSMAS